ncbi:MAG: MltA domain-containing protein [Aphanocapsa sp. GSE-SYN-MK-11-07L]|jgi:membrane-bound lytic murein transglycosylase A|nr:MltA domain-containing protein [Aphanocapsa sp. GSE-SYN-MK-11-07L]
MLKPFAALCLTIGLAVNTPTVALSPIAQPPANVGLDDQIWAQAGKPGDRARLLRAIDYSLDYLKTEKAEKNYKAYTAPGQPGSALGSNLKLRVTKSLQRFRQLVVKSKSARQLQAAVKREFAFYQAAGKDNAGKVEFTGYYEAVYPASPVPTATYRYPLYGLPPDFKQWDKPHPTRTELEGTDGLQGSKGQLRGLELVWLRDRMAAFLVQVQGSAKLQLTNGKVMTVGYAGKTDYPYVSIGQELIKDGKLTREELTLPRLIAYFQAHPQAMDTYLPRNQSFVFFKNTQGGAATGSLSVPVTPERSIATDKTLMPPGALALIYTAIPYPNRAGKLEKRLVSRFTLDQDTGSAIKGPGRVDIFMGTGAKAKARAGLINTPGQLYYLLLK